MVVGNGMIAQKFGKYIHNDTILFFASGVSDSKCTDPVAYQREENLLKTTIAANPGKMVVYISTCSVYDPSLADSQYVNHKKKLEGLIQQSGEKYLVVRTSNLAGPSGNPKTVLNFFVNSIATAHPFQLWTMAGRNILDLDDFYSIVTYILDNNLHVNKIINVANKQNYKVTEIVHAIEQHLQKKANCELLEKGAEFNIDVTEVAPVLDKLHIEFTDDYLPRILKKYY